LGWSEAFPVIPTGLHPSILFLPICLISQGVVSNQSTDVRDEEHIIRRARGNDVDAFNQLVLTYQNLAYSVAYRMLQDEASAADAVQDSFIKAFRSLSTFRGGSFKSWLMRIVVNTCYDVLRVRKRRTVESLDDLPVAQEYAPQLRDRAQNPEEHAERMELNALLEAGIATLPDNQRLAVLLCDVHGYSYEEIADITQQPMGTVKSRLSRGRAKLRVYLLQHPELLPATFRHNRT
jgi:RNA polymerase sigma-70 factor (ECF subfamily)